MENVKCKKCGAEIKSIENLAVYQDGFIEWKPYLDKDELGNVSVAYEAGQFESNEGNVWCCRYCNTELELGRDDEGNDIGEELVIKLLKQAEENKVYKG